MVFVKKKGAPQPNGWEGINSCGAMLQYFYCEMDNLNVGRFKKRISKNK